MLFLHVLLLPLSLVQHSEWNRALGNNINMLISNGTCFSEPRASNVFMAKVHIRYCGLLVRGSHVAKYNVMGVTSWFMPAGWRPMP
jgi:hypothetical protein